jgi:hypothetical protein
MAVIKASSVRALIGASIGYWRHSKSRCITLFDGDPVKARPSDTEEDAKWRAEFDEAGEIDVRENLSRGGIINYDPKRQFAFRWLREQVKATKLREQQMYRYAQWTFWAAVGAVVLGIFTLWRSP